MTESPLVSVVLPARNEAEALPHVISGIYAALEELPFEIIVVDDGSTDATAEVVRKCMEAMPELRLLQHQTSCGQSAALRSGIHAARGRLIATLDADGQNPPGDLLRLIAPFLDTRQSSGLTKGLGLVQGQRLLRNDRWSRRVASRLANGLRGALLRDGVRDSGCGMKAFPREVYLLLPFFDHIHRFMPAMVLREGYSVKVIDVGHAGRLAGRSNYSNLQRAIVGFVDLMGTAWLIRRHRYANVVEISQRHLQPEISALSNHEVSRQN